MVLKDVSSFLLKKSRSSRGDLVTHLKRLHLAAELSDSRQREKPSSTPLVRSFEDCGVSQLFVPGL